MKRIHRLVAMAGVTSLVAWVIVQLVSPPAPIAWTAEMLAASRLMDKAVETVRTRCEQQGIEIDEREDPNRTGLIGPELTPLMTTLGDPAAKRTTTTPDMAALLLVLLRDAGVARGDTVAVGASASFPALLAATLAACRAGGIHPVVIISLGASSFGATRPELTLLDLYRLWFESGLCDTGPAAVTLGGTRDVGAGFPAGFRARLASQIAAGGYSTFSLDDLPANVERRLQMYAGGTGADRVGPAGRIRAFVNIGGSWANLGVSPLALRLEPGLIKPSGVALPPADEQGVLFSMAARGIPIIHLLFIRGLARRHSLAWDPVPLPAPGSTRLTRGMSEQGVLFWIVAGSWLAIMIGLVAAGRSGRRQGDRRRGGRN